MEILIRCDFACFWLYIKRENELGELDLILGMAGSLAYSDFNMRDVREIVLNKQQLRESLCYLRTCCYIYNWIVISHGCEYVCDMARREHHHLFLWYKKNLSCVSSSHFFSNHTYI